MTKQPIEIFLNDASLVFTSIEKKTAKPMKTTYEQIEYEQTNDNTIKIDYTRGDRVKIDFKFKYNSYEFSYDAIVNETMDMLSAVYFEDTSIIYNKIGELIIEASDPGKMKIGYPSSDIELMGVSKPIVSVDDGSDDKIDLSKYVAKDGDSTINGSLTVSGSLYIRGGLTITNNASIPNYYTKDECDLRFVRQYPMSQTITHYAPIEGDIKAQGAADNVHDFVVGSPCFMSGKVYKRENDEWIPSTVNDRQDCICSVMIEGNEKNYVGVIVEVDEKNKSVTFATHGDFMFNVDDSNSYEVGDVVLYDGRILDYNVTLTLNLQRSIVGTISGIIDENTVAVFRT